MQLLIGEVKYLEQLGGFERTVSNAALQQDKHKEYVEQLNLYSVKFAGEAWQMTAMDRTQLDLKNNILTKDEKKKTLIDAPVGDLTAGQQKRVKTEFRNMKSVFDAIYESH